MNFRDNISKSTIARQKNKVVTRERSVDNKNQRRKDMIKKRHYKILALYTLLLPLFTTTNDATPYILHLKNVKASSSSLAASFLQELATIFNLDTFIETGTFYGDTTAAAANIFNHIHTIELSPQLYQQAIKRFKETRNISVHQGDSAEELKKIVPAITGSILFWLDSHYCKGGTKAESNTPILQELAAIKFSGITDAVILIDDICCFRPFKDIPEHCEAAGFPTILELKKAMLAINPNYQFVIYGDIALAWPAEKNVMPSLFLQAITISRTFNDASNDPESVLSAEELIARSHDGQLQSIRELCYWRTSWSSVYYHYWSGLGYLEQKEYEKAYKEFMYAYSNGFTHWRTCRGLAQALEGLEN